MCYKIEKVCLSSINYFILNQDECDKKRNLTCSQLCFNTTGSYLCACDTVYALNYNLHFVFIASSGFIVDCVGSLSA